MEYKPYDAPYWHRRWEREREAEQRKKWDGTLNYDEIVNAANDFMTAYNEYRRAAADRRKSSKDLERYYRNEDMYERIFCAVCYATRIPPDAAIAASRIGDKYYELHGGTLCVDNEKLIRSLM